MFIHCIEITNSRYWWGCLKHWIAVTFLEIGGVKYEVTYSAYLWWPTVLAFISFNQIEENFSSLFNLQPIWIYLTDNANLPRWTHTYVTFPSIQKYCLYFCCFRSNPYFHTYIAPPPYYSESRTLCNMVYII